MKAPNRNTFLESHRVEDRLIRLRRCGEKCLLRWSFFILLTCLFGCASRSPVSSGMVVTFTKARSALSTNGASPENSLQVRWLGTACYLLQLGDRVVFTDPFLTHHSLTRVGLGGSLESDPRIVSNTLTGLPVPQAIFVGHSHYDHLLDAAECLKHPGWSEVPVFGSLSTHNILRGYGAEFADNWRRVSTNAGWQQVAPGIRYQAIPARHGRQLAFLPLLYPGAVNEPMRRKPARAFDFKVGESYAFLFELSNDHVTNTVYFVGASHRHQEGFPDESVRSVDVAILCVPTWKLSEGYPENIIRRLKPRHILASHYDNFFQVNGKATEIVPGADLVGFLVRTQAEAAYPEFESILLPSVGSVLPFAPTATRP